MKINPDADPHNENWLRRPVGPSALTGDEPRFERVPDHEAREQIVAWLLRTREARDAALAVEAAEAWLTRHPRDWRVMTAIEQAQRFV